MKYFCQKAKSQYRMCLSTLFIALYPFSVKRYALASPRYMDICCCLWLFMIQRFPLFRFSLSPRHRINATQGNARDWNKQKLKRPLQMCTGSHAPTQLHVTLQNTSPPLLQVLLLPLANINCHFFWELQLHCLFECCVSCIKLHGHCMISLSWLLWPCYVGWDPELWPCGVGWVNMEKMGATAVRVYSGAS